MMPYVVCSRPRLGRWRPTVFVVAAVAWIAACVRGTEDGAAGVGARDTTAIDSLPAPAPSNVIVAQPIEAAPPTGGQTPAAPASADTTSLAAKLDSLRAEVAALHAALEETGARTGGPVGINNAPLPDSLTAQTIVQGAAQEARSLMLRVFWAAFVMALAYLLVWAATWVLDVLAERTTTRRLMIKRLGPIVRLAVWAFTVYYIVVGVFQIHRNNLLAAAAALSVVLGLAAQDILKNVFGGLIIILDRPFQVGDKITVDGTYGEVVSIGLRATRLVTPDDNLVSVANQKVVEGKVANANAGTLVCQVVVDLYLPGWVDVVEAKQIAIDAASSSKYLYLDKPVVVNVKDEFKETFLTHLVVKAYVLDTRYEFAFASDVTEAAKSEFRKRGWLRPFIRSTGYAPAPDPAYGDAPSEGWSEPAT